MEMERRKGVESTSEKEYEDARGGERVADPTRTERAAGEGGYVPQSGKRGYERGRATGEERRTRRYERERRREEGRRATTRRERRSRERGAGWTRTSEREGARVREGRDEKRGQIREEREAERYREGAKERGREGGKREDEREGAHRRTRRRERDGRICVLKQTFDQSADCCQSYVAAAYPSVPVAGPRIQFRVFTRRGNQGLVRARGYPRKPRVKYIAIPYSQQSRAVYVSNLTLARLPRPSGPASQGSPWLGAIAE